MRFSVRQLLAAVAFCCGFIALLRAEGLPAALVFACLVHAAVAWCYAVRVGAVGEVISYFRKSSD